MLSRWRKELEHYNPEFKGKKSTSSGPKLRYSELNMKLLAYFKETHSNRLKNNRKILVIRAHQLEPELKNADVKKVTSIIGHFCERNNIVLCKKNKSVKKSCSDQKFVLFLQQFCGCIIRKVLIYHWRYVQCRSTGSVYPWSQKYNTGSWRKWAS